jgi:hypothetical protein
MQLWQYSALCDTGIMWPVAFGSLLLLCVSIKVSRYSITFYCTVHITAEGNHRVYNLWCCTYKYVHCPQWSYSAEPSTFVWALLSCSENGPVLMTHWSEPCCHVLRMDQCWWPTGLSLAVMFWEWTGVGGPLVWALLSCSENGPVLVAHCTQHMHQRQYHRYEIVPDSLFVALFPTEST